MSGACANAADMFEVMHACGSLQLMTASWCVRDFTVSANRGSIWEGLSYELEPPAEGPTNGPAQATT